MGMTLITTISDQPYNFSPNINYKVAKKQSMKILKKIKVLFREQFHYQNDKINRIVNAMINSVEQYINEGFYSDDSEITEKESKKPIIIKGQDDQQNSPQFFVKELNDKIKEQTNQIRDLQLKVDIRDQLINEITNGHIKDVLHLKESLYRKNNGFSDYNYYEVKYFEDTEIADPKIRDKCNERLESLRIEFMNTQNELISKINKMQLQETKHKYKPETTAQLIKRALEQDSNPYHIWKIIQDLQGGTFFMDIFEKQSPLEGINYREVNRIIQSGQLHERDYAKFKDHVRSLYQQFTDFRQKHLENIDKQMCNTLLQMNEWCIFVDKEVIKVKMAYQDKLRVANEQNFKLQNQQVVIAQSYDEMYNRQCRKLMFMRWLMISKIKKQLNQEQLKKMIKTLTKTQLTEIIKQKFVERELKLKQLFLKTLNNLEQINFKFQDKEIDYYAQITINQLNVQTIKVLENKLCQLEHTFHEKSDLLSLYEVSYQNLIRAIDPSYCDKNSSIKNINREILTNLAQKGSKWNVVSQRLFGEINEQKKYLQCQMKNEQKVKTTMNDQSTITEIFDLKNDIKVEKPSKKAQQQLENIEKEIIREFLNEQTVIQIFEKDYHTIQKNQEVQTIEVQITQNEIETCKLTESDIQIKQPRKRSSMKKPIIYEGSSKKEGPVQNWLNSTFRADSPKYQNNTRYSSFDTNIIQTQSQQKQIEFVRKAESEINQRSKLEVFHRLYNDSEQKKERLRELSNRIRQMDKSHWEDIIHIISEAKIDETNYQTKQVIFNPNQKILKPGSNDQLPFNDDKISHRLTYDNQFRRVKLRSIAGKNQDFNTTLNNKPEQLSLNESVEKKRKTYINSCIQDFEHKILKVSKLDQQIANNQKQNRTMEPNLIKILNIQEELEGQRNSIHQKREINRRKNKIL